MDSIDYFVPGLTTGHPHHGIGTYLPSMREGVVSAYVSALTRPGELVLDPFCQTGRVLAESVAAGRRALGVNLNPVSVRWIEQLLWPLESRQAAAALSRLGSSPRGATRLREHVMSLYATRCPTCQKGAVAESFTWDRDENKPVEKRVRCAACGIESTGPADDEDIRMARQFEPRGMAYWYALERAVPAEPGTAGRLEARERAAAVVEAYTARTLSALADIVRKFDAASDPDRLTLEPILLAGFEAALALHTEDRPRPRSLKIPTRFVECNIWLVMEETAETAPHIEPRRSAPPPRSRNVAALMARQDAAACLVSTSGRSLAKLIPPASVKLVLALPPEPDPTFWALSAVWAAWLWGGRLHGDEPGKIEEESLRALLARRRADMDWWWRGVAHTLGALRPMLAEDGHVMLVTPEAGEDTLVGLLLAGASSGLALVRALIEPRLGLRIVWRPQEAPAEPVELSDQTLADEIGEHAQSAAPHIIRERGEPTPWPFVHAAIYSELAQAHLLWTAARMPEGGPEPLGLIKVAVQDALRIQDSPVYPVPDPRDVWWLADPRQAAEPLADRVERAVYELLARAGPEQPEGELLAHLYRQFPGVLTPEYATIRMCLESYAQEQPAGVWTQREEDVPDTRQVEVASMRDALLALGRRLGCEVTEHEGHLTWSQEHRPLYTFTVSVTAELGKHLLARRPPRGQPVLTLPGGRGALVHYKLRRDMRLREAAQGAGWTFLKFRLLRNLAEQESTDLLAFRNTLGLDPPIEREGTQMALL